MKQATEENPHVNTHYRSLGENRAFMGRRDRKRRREKKTGRVKRRN